MKINKNKTGNAVPSQTKPVVCLRCGKELRTGVKFCGSCGYPTQRQTRDQQKTTNNQAGRQEPRQQTSTAYNANRNAVPPEMMTRDQLIAEIDRMMIYFSRVQDIYDEFDRCVEIRNAELDKKEREMRRRRHSDSLLDDPDAGSHFFLSLSIVLLIAIPFIMAIGTKPYSILISIGCFLLSSSIGFLFVWSKVKGNQEEKEFKDQMNSVRAKLTEYHRNYGNCIVTVYNANPRVLRKVREYLVSGKANTLKEALLLAYS